MALPISRTVLPDFTAISPGKSRHDLNTYTPAPARMSTTPIQRAVRAQSFARGSSAGFSGGGGFPDVRSSVTVSLDQASRNGSLPRGLCQATTWLLLEFCLRAMGCSRLLAFMRAEVLKAVSRIVVKLGTGVLTDSRKQLDPAQVEQLVAQLAAQRQAGKEVVLVTSGAVGAGMGALGFDRRPSSLADL